MTPSRRGLAVLVLLAVACSPASSYKCALEVQAGVRPFVMWITQRTGSTWVTELLNSHPGITMLGEKYNNCGDETCFANMCDFLTARSSYTPWDAHAAAPRPVNLPVKPVRGFKQKFLYCDGASRPTLRDPGTFRGAADALEECLLPSLTDPKDYSRSTHFSEYSHSVFTQTGAAIICSLRRSAFDLALSVVMHSELVKACGKSNTYTEEVRKCWNDFLARQPGGKLRLDKEEFMGKVKLQVETIQGMVDVCEAQARRSPVFFLWYEDLVDDTEKTLAALLRFIGAPPAKLTAQVQRVNEGAQTWIANYDELEELSRWVRADAGSDYNTYVFDPDAAAGAIPPPASPPPQPPPPSQSLVLRTPMVSSCSPPSPRTPPEMPGGASSFEGPMAMVVGAGLGALSLLLAQALARRACGARWFGRGFSKSGAGRHTELAAAEFPVRGDVEE